MKVCKIGLCLINAIALQLQAAPCGKVMTVNEVLRFARTLDSQVVCVRGTVRTDSGILFEMMPTTSDKLKRQRIGLIEWSPETGVKARLYKPGSFKTLAIAMRPPSESVGSVFLDITLRAVVFYKRHLLTKAAEMFPKTPQYSRIAGTAHETELVVVEILDVRKQAPSR